METFRDKELSHLAILTAKKCNDCGEIKYCQCDKPSGYSEIEVVACDWCSELVEASKYEAHYDYCVSKFYDSWD